MSCYEELNGTITLSNKEATEIAKLLKSKFDGRTAKNPRGCRRRVTAGEEDVFIAVSIGAGTVRNATAQVRVEVDYNNHSVQHANDGDLLPAVLRALKKAKSAKGRLYYNSEYADCTEVYATFG